jgi:type 1 glutamine amidotransferase
MMIKNIILAVIITMIPSGKTWAAPPATPTDTVNVVILTGASNHDWKTTTPLLKQLLEKSGWFKVDVITDPEMLTRKKLANYDVLMSNWNAFGKKKPPPWSKSLKTAYVEFVRNGGGHVVIHAGSSSFYNWADYHAIGCATWKGKTGHKQPHEFEVRITGDKHPLTRGLKNFKTTDELWFHPFVQPNANVLAESFSKTTGKWEPTAITSQFGKGRCFTLLLGHNTETMQSHGFQSLLIRGTQWTKNPHPPKNH